MTSFIDSQMEMSTEPYTRFYREQDGTFSPSELSLQDSRIIAELTLMNSLYTLFQ